MKLAEMQSWWKQGSLYFSSRLILKHAAEGAPVYCWGVGHDDLYESLPTPVILLLYEVLASEQRSEVCDPNLR